MATAAAGIRYPERIDLLLALFDPGTSVAGVLTQSKTASAPVDWCREQASARHGPRARGQFRQCQCLHRQARARGGASSRPKPPLRPLIASRPRSIIASTGVIGEPLDAGKIAARLGELAANAKPDAFEAAARAIMTTDTFPKLATRQAEIDGVAVTINGIAKGAGMIAPEMATMLAFLFTDAAIEPAALRDCLHPAVEDSFNAITIDGDTSTSDTHCCSPPACRHARRAVDRAWRRSAARDVPLTLHDLMRDLAQQVVKDGEGLTKFVTVKVTGAESKDAARIIAKSIANSPLVKTALAGEDPNWGRIVAAIGKAGEKADRDQLAVWLGDILVAKDGEVAPGYREAMGAAYMKQPEIAITVDVGVGKDAAIVWTCDLTKDYIAINADYRS